MSSSYSSTLRILRQVGIIIGGAVGLIICFFTLQIIVGIFFGILMTSGESVQHSVPSPDNQITALVISDGCGITCGCTIRVDLKTKDQYRKGIWRGVDVCDATVTWVSTTEFYILYNNNQQTRIDTRTLGE